MVERISTFVLVMILANFSSAVNRSNSMRPAVRSQPNVGDYQNQAQPKFGDAEIRNDLVRAAFSDKPIANEPLANKPLANEPLANKPLANKPLANKPLANKPLANKPLANGPLTNKPLANKPLAQMTFSEFKEREKKREADLEELRFKALQVVSEGIERVKNKTRVRAVNNRHLYKLKEDMVKKRQVQSSGVEKKGKLDKGKSVSTR